MTGEAEKSEEQIEKERRAQQRLQKRTAEFEDSLKAPRPGVRRIDPAEFEEQEVTVSGTRIDLSPVQWIDPAKLAANPHNDYPPLSDEELSELASDIAEKGLLVPLILRLSDNTIICGHNRTRAAIHAKEKKVPVQRVLRALTEAEERELMKSENDRRRGGSWSREKKEEFIREHFEEVIHEDRRGGNFGNQYTGGKSSMNLSQNPGGLAKEIEEKSRGKITEGTAKRIISGMRKEKKKPAIRTESTRYASLSEKEKRRGEKLALHLRTLKQTREKLEEKLGNVKAEEKRVLKELKSIGQPELFGVE